MRGSWSRTRWTAIGAAVAIAVGSGTLALVTASGGGTASAFVPITPCRLLDTRSTSPVGPRSTPILAGESLTVQVTGSNGQCVIPATATAIVINVTALGPSAAGFITVYPADVGLPTASNLNFSAGQNPTPNLVTVSLSATGAIKIFNATGNVGVLGDIAGYYQPDNGLVGAGAACDVNGLAGVIVNGVDTNHNVSSKCFTSLVSTLAGRDYGFADGQGNNAAFADPTGVAVDSVGNIYVSDQSNHRIRKISVTGIVTTLAGNGVNAYADGSGGSASFSNPGGVAVDSVGNVFVADTFNHRIRKITPAGQVTTFAGSSQGFTNENGVLAEFNTPRGVAIDSAGNLYVADGENNAIRKITPGGAVTTFVGGSLGTTDGVGPAAQFWGPNALAIDSAGNLYVADSYNHRIRKVTPAGVVTTLAGSSQGYSDGTGVAAQFKEPLGVAVDSVGNVYVADTGNYVVRKITPAGVVTTLAGDGTNAYAEGIGVDAQFGDVIGIVVDNSGTIYVTDIGSSRIRRIN